MGIAVSRFREGRGHLVCFSRQEEKLVARAFPVLEGRGLRDSGLGSRVKTLEFSVQGVGCKV